jgi:hypothetical protein
MIACPAALRHSGGASRPGLGGRGRRAAQRPAARDLLHARASPCFAGGGAAHVAAGSRRYAGMRKGYRGYVPAGRLNARPKTLAVRSPSAPK